MPKKSAHLAEIAELKFRPLKKNLRQSFNEIRHIIESGKLPDKKIVGQFQDEVSLMVSYPGFGDQFYGPFKEACLKLLALHEANDIEGFQKQVASIRSLKKQCHGQFKQLT